MPTENPYLLSGMPIFCDAVGRLAKWDGLRTPTVLFGCHYTQRRTYDVGGSARFHYRLSKRSIR
jgi:hypothetical protein